VLRCADEWTGPINPDWQMIAYCIREQYAAFQALQR
jgi:hypothetical protein